MPKGKEKKEDAGKYQEFRKAALAIAFFSGVGVYFSVVVGICIFLGNFVDGLFHLRAAGKLMGILFGIPLGCYCVYRQVRQLL